MKTFRNIFTLIIFTALFSSCLDEYTEVFTANSPVYMTYEELRDAVNNMAPRDLENPGKIYFKDGYLFVNEELEGVHIIDNRILKILKTSGLLKFQEMWILPSKKIYCMLTVILIW